MAIKASEIEDRESLEEWLEGQSVDVARVIAARSALRVLPIALSIHQENHPNLTLEIKHDLTLQVFRANFISWVARKYPTHDIKDAASYAGYAADAAARAAARAAVARAAAASRAAVARAAAASRAAVYAVRAADAANASRAGATGAAGAAYVANAGDILVSNSPYVSIRKDAEWLEKQPNNIDGLINAALWLQHISVLGDDYNLRNNLIIKFEAFQLSDLAQNTSFGLIADWYAALLPQKGKPRSLFGEKKDIELATQPFAFWQGKAQEVMDRVAELVRPPVRARFFISYSTKDEVAAKFIGDVIEDAGYQVFAQYKDMPTGSVFIEEMKRGLASSDRFIPVYSPNYVESDFCQAEWNAAFRLDPLGLKRKMLPFLIEPTELNELASPIIYTNLVNQPEDERREKILSALDDGGGLTRKEQRKKLAASASPQIVENEDDQLDTAPNEEFDQPINDPALVQLLADILKTLKGLCEQFKNQNRLAIFHNALVTYLDEIEVSGVGLRMGTLERAINVIRDEIEEDSQEFWYKGGAKESLRQFLTMHQALDGFYPKTDIRKQLEENADIDQEYLSFEKMDSDLVEFEQTLILSDLEGKISKRLFSLTKQQVYLVKQLLQLEVKGQPLLPDDIFVSEADKERKRQNEKKKQGASFGSLLDNMLARIEKMNSIANSDTGKGLIKAAAKIVSKIWWGT